MLGTPVESASQAVANLTFTVTPEQLTQAASNVESKPVAPAGLTSTKAEKAELASVGNGGADRDAARRGKA